MPGIGVLIILTLAPFLSIADRNGYSPSLVVKNGEAVFAWLEVSSPHVAKGLLTLGFGGNFLLAIISASCCVFFGAVLLFHATHTKQFPGAAFVGFIINLPLFLLSYVFLAMAIYLINFFVI